MKMSEIYGQVTPSDWTRKRHRFIGLSISSVPATPIESDFACYVAGNWIQNPFCRDFASGIAFAFSLVWLDHYNGNQCTYDSGGSRISRWWGGADLLGGHQPLMSTLFGENICENERNWSCRGGRAAAAPPQIHQCMIYSGSGPWYLKDGLWFFVTMENNSDSV